MGQDYGARIKVNQREITRAETFLKTRSAWETANPSEIKGKVAIETPYQIRTRSLGAR